MKRRASVTSRVGRFVGLGIALAGVLSFSLPARAEVDDLGAYDPAHDGGRRFESPQHVALELRFGRYVPKVDDEFSGATPYKTMFSDHNRYSAGLEVDWQALRIPAVGTLGIGLGAEYTKSTAGSFIKGSNDRSGEDTTLAVFPLYAVAVLRADVLARETPIPLVAYAKLGVGTAVWRVTNGGGTAKVGGDSGVGLSYGPQFALGGMLLLDTFDPSAAMQFDNDLGVNNSYLFIEWYDSILNKFGSGGQMQVGANTWVLGLAFEI